MSARPLLFGGQERENSLRDEESTDDLNEWSKNVGTASKPSRILQTRSYIIARGFVVIVEVILCALLITNVVFIQRQSALGSQPASDEKSKEFRSRYGNDVEYMSLDHKYDHLWSDYLEGHNGMIRINPEQEDEEPEWGAIGMFHQLHCLAGMRMAMQKSRDGEEIGLDQHDNLHWPHCFYYLRQAILCSADDTIERGPTFGSKILPNNTIGVSKWGIIDGTTDWRTCQDSDRLFYLRAKYGYGVEKDRLQLLKDLTEKEV